MKDSLEATNQSVEQSATWIVRNVDVEVRYRMKVQATRKRKTIGELVNFVLTHWLNAGAPDEIVD